MGCPVLRKLPVEGVMLCKNHRYISNVCALRNALMIKTWMLQQQQDPVHELSESFRAMYI